MVDLINNINLNNIILQFSKENYNKYEKELEKLKILKDVLKDGEDKKIENTQKIRVSFLLFSYYKNWIFPYISNFNGCQGESNNIYTFYKLKENKLFTLDSNFFILWYFYLFYNFYQENKINPEEINQLRYLLSETNKVVSSLYEKGILSIDNVFNFLDIYLLSLEQYVKTSEYINLLPHEQKFKKLIIFKNFFDLLQNISIISTNEEKMKDFESILKRLEKINNYSVLNNEINIYLLINNNIIQDYMNNLLQNINYVKIDKLKPTYKEIIIKFYSHFLLYKYKKSNIFSDCMDVLRQSFDHLYNFINNKNSILRDICINNFNSILINELFELEQEKNKNENAQYPLNSSFFFDQKQSVISFTHQSMKLDKVIIFLSFQIGKNNDDFNDNNAQELPLILIKRKSNKNKDFNNFLKIFLKKNETKEKGKTKYSLCISQPKDSKNNNNIINIINIENDKFYIDDNNTYYCAFYLNENKIKTFLYYELLKKNNNILSKENAFLPMKNEESLHFYIGNDERNSFYNGKIGPVIMINSPSKKEVKDINQLISEILLLKNRYKDFLIIKSELSNHYNFDLVEYFEKKSMIDIYENSEDNENPKITIKGVFNCLLYLLPNSFNYLENKEINETEENPKKNLPVFSDICENNKEYIISKINISISNYENIRQLFVMDNGLGLICLQVEYYNQFLGYYLLKTKNNKIYNEEELDIIVKDIKTSLKKNILLLGYYNHSKYLFNSFKKIYVNLYNCLLNLNKIKPIINDLFNELLILKDIYRGIILSSKQSFSQEANINSNDLYLINNNQNYNKIIFDKNNDYYKYFLHENISYYIGIIELLFTSDFYNKNKKEDNIKLIEILFKNLLSIYAIIENNDDKENTINITFYNNIFYKLLNFISLIESFFCKKESETNDIKVDKNEEIVFIHLLVLNFKLLFNVINIKDDDENIKISNEYFREIFRFVLGNNRKNYYIIYSYLNAIYDFSKGKFIYKFNENEIYQLNIFLYEFNNNKDIKYEGKKEIEMLLISIIIEYLFSNPDKNISININFIEDYIKNNEITKELSAKLKIILEKYFLNIFDLKKNNNFIIKKLDSKEMMQYFWNFFLFLIAFIKTVKSKKKDDYKNNIYEIINILSFIEAEIEKVMNLDILNQYIIFYLTNFLKFAYHILNDDEINFLFNDKIFLQAIDGIFEICKKSTLIHCNIYVTINEKDNSENETKKLISELLLEIYIKHLEQIYTKYSNTENKEIISDEELYFINIFSKNIDNKYVSEFIYSDYNNLKKNREFNCLDEYKTIFFLSDFLKLLSSENKYAKKFEKNKYISQLLEFYKIMKDTILDIYKTSSNDNNNNIFDFYFTSYYFYQMYEFRKRIDCYLNNDEIKKQDKLVDKLRNFKSIVFKFNNIILIDHIKLNDLYKDFYSRKIQNNDLVLRNVLKIIVTIIFNKKNKKKQSTDFIIEIEKELSNNDIILGRKSVDINMQNQIQDKMDINESNIPKKRSSFSNNNIEVNNVITPNKEEDNKNNEINNNEKEYENNNLIINNDNEIINDKEEENSDNEKENEKPEEIILLDLSYDIYSKNIFDKIDKNYIINPKKELMKTLFGIYFEKSFFNNKTFQIMKNYFLNKFDKTEIHTKLLNFPTKIKNFTNGLEPPLFLKDYTKFFISKIFPITHTFFYDYMNEHNILSESIILLKKNISFSSLNNIKEKNEFDCELIKNDKIYFGHMVNSIEDEFLIFKEKEFKLDDNASNIKEEFEKKMFSLSSLDVIATKNAKAAKINAKNKFLDIDIFPNEEINYNKTVIIFYSDIDEIVERRFLYIWQGIEIFLKNGKSYIFNMLTEENYNILKKSLKNLNILFREKDFFLKSKVVNNWLDEKLTTYEYLLFMNKYGSRSLNDTSQYYVFPWILNNFINLKEINENESDIYEYMMKNNQKEKTNDNILELNDNENRNDNDNNNEIKRYTIGGPGDKNVIGMIYYNNFRQFQYPVSAQTESNRETKILKYNDEEEKYHHHHGTHYSNGSYIFYYLMRLEPYTSQLVELQNYNQENPDRMLLNLKDTIKIVNSGNDNRELIPELFTNIEYFVNLNCAYFGHKKTKKIVDDIEKIWEYNNNSYYNNISNYVQFIIEHKKLLNSKEIAYNITSWFDNVFGIGQIPKKKEESVNIFIKTSYENYNLHTKLDKLLKKEEDIKKIKKKFVNKINLIISFGQTPQKIFKEGHKRREYKEKNIGSAEEDPDNYGKEEEDDYIGDDFVDTFVEGEFRNDNKKISLKKTGLFFEVNSSLEKVFILCETNELLIIDTNFYSDFQSTSYTFNYKHKNIYKIPKIYFFNKFKSEYNTDYYIYNLKYCLSSFPINLINNSSNEPNPYLYSNKYIRFINHIQKDSNINKDKDKDKVIFMTCRHLDNSFKIHLVNNNKKIIQTCSYFCEDFVMSCKAISSNSFIIGLKNGKLIKASIYEKEKQTKDKANGDIITSESYKIIYDKYILGHKGSINMIEVDDRLGVIITGGDDNKLYLRKLYDFELLTSIKIKSKFIITLAKISPMNFLYILCYNKIKNKFIIFGYTLTGLKFAKSEYTYFTNLDFTNRGNIISLINEYEIGILNCYNLRRVKIDEKDKDFEKYKNVQESLKNIKLKWMQYNDFRKTYNKERNIISYLSLNIKTSDYSFNTLKVTNISYFQ